MSHVNSLRNYKLKEFADNNITFDENGEKFSKSVEYAVGKGEIVGFEQYLYPKKCSRDLYCRQIKTQICVEKGLICCLRILLIWNSKICPNVKLKLDLTLLYKQALVFMCLQYKF